MRSWAANESKLSYDRPILFRSQRSVAFWSLGR
jgi:hypothetical protein